MLDAALMRQDGEGETHDLPAYRELLFLYSIARDLGEHLSNAPVDLELPMDGSVEKPIEELTASRLMGFGADQPAHRAGRPDVTRPMAGSPRRRGQQPGFHGAGRPGPSATDRAADRADAGSAPPGAAARRASVSSFLAKQKRTMRCSKPPW